MRFAYYVMIEKTEKGGDGMKGDTASAQLYGQIRHIFVICISFTLLLAFGASLWISLRQDAKVRDGALLSAVQVAAGTPLLMENTDTALLQEYVERTVVNVPSIDVFAVYDAAGMPTAFYDLDSGSADLTGIPPLSEDILSYFDTGEITLLYNHEAPANADRCAYAVIYGSDSRVAGYAMAAIYMRSIHQTVLSTLVLHLLVAVAALVIGNLLSLRLTGRIKEELLGYEPDAFRRLFLQRSDILNALDEGLLAIDCDKRITYLNQTAADMLQTTAQDALGKPLSTFYPRSTIARVMETGKAEYNVNLESIKHIAVISDRIPLWRNGEIEGAVAIFRNRTEVMKLAQDLTGVRHIVEALRAYTHEFTNKLHVILGLLQLGETRQAEDYVLQITETRAQSIRFISDRIHEPSISALLIGKAYRAAELGIRFILTPYASLNEDNRYLPAGALVTILGNLVENAFDALRISPASALREVTVSIRDGEHGLLISVDDTGPGMDPTTVQHIFEQGYTTKGDGHGTGLALVQRMVSSYHGDIRVESEPGAGTSFIITVSDPY